jgi:hypothetical protein
MIGIRGGIVKVEEEVGGWEKKAGSRAYKSVDEYFFILGMSASRLAGWKPAV